MSSVLQSPSELVSISFKAQNAATAKLLMSWGSMASPVLKMQAASQGIQPSTPSSRGHWPALVSPLPWSLSVWLMMEGGWMAWLWAPGTEAGAWGETQQLWTLLLRGHYQDSARKAGFGATKTEVAKCQKYHDLQSNFHFQPAAIETTGVYGKSTALFWVVFRRNLLMCLATPGSTSGSTSVCPWLWPGEMLPAYWPVCKFDLILPVLFLAAFTVLTTITAYHLSLYQCVAIALRIFVLSVRFIVPSVVQCHLMHWLNILSKVYKIYCLEYIRVYVAYYSR